MVFVRYERKGKTSYGVVNGETISEMNGTPLDRYTITRREHRLREVRLLAPCMPQKIFALAGNYVNHLGDADPPSEPQPFVKVSSSVIGPGETIILPKNQKRIEEEAELVVVIGRRCRGVSRADALGCVLGYTCGNDVSARVWQKSDLNWWRAKSSDTFSPIGPSIVTGLDGSCLLVTARINGKEVQRSNTSELIFDIPSLISFLSQSVTLESGDLIFTGTSGKPAELHDGDVVEVEVEGIGILRNSVKAE